MEVVKYSVYISPSKIKISIGGGGAGGVAYIVICHSSNHTEAKLHDHNAIIEMAFLGRVLVFSIPGCPFCKRAKSLLGSHKVPYYDVDLDKYPERRYEMQERTGRRTVPQIFFNNRHIGGWEELKQLVGLL